MGRGGQDELEIQAPARAGRASAERRISSLPGFSAWRRNERDVRLLEALLENGTARVDETELAGWLDRDPYELHSHLAKLELYDLTRRSGYKAGELSWSITNVGAEVATGSSPEFYASGDIASLDGSTVKIIEANGEFVKVLSLNDGEIRGPIHSDELSSLLAAAA